MKCRVLLGRVVVKGVVKRKIEIRGREEVRETVMIKERRVVVSGRKIAVSM